MTSYKCRQARSRKRPLAIRGVNIGVNQYTDRDTVDFCGVCYRSYLGDHSICVIYAQECARGAYRDS